MIDSTQGSVVMVWVKIDDAFFRHPKIVMAGRDARDLYLAALCYCSAQLTDGFIPSAAIRQLAADACIKREMQTTNRLVAVGLWHVTENGFAIHDYLDYNPSSEQVKSQRASTQKRVARWRGNAPVTVNVTPLQDQSNGVGNGVGNTTPVPDPVPESLTTVAIAPVVAPDKPDAVQSKPAPARKRAMPAREVTTSAAIATSAPSWIELHALFAPLVAIPSIGRPVGTEWSAFGKAIKMLEEKGATPEEVPKRAENYAVVLPNSPLTLQAFVKHWNLCGTSSHQQSLPYMNGHGKATKHDIIQAGLELFHDTIGTYQGHSQAPDDVAQPRRNDAADHRLDIPVRRSLGPPGR